MPEPTIETMNQTLFTYRATCMRVVDGDTVDLNVDLGLRVHQHARFRLFGIDTPETYGVKKDSEEYKAGLAAKSRLAELIVGKELWIDTHKDETGKYGRWLATVWVVLDKEVTNINELLVEEGHAEERSY